MVDVSRKVSGQKSFPVFDDVVGNFETLLRCVHCGEYFDAGLRRPRFLACFHSVCESCVACWLLEQNFVVCKGCGCRTDLPNKKVDDLRPNENVYATLLFLSSSAFRGQLRLMNLSDRLPRIRAMVESWSLFGCHDDGEDVVHKSVPLTESRVQVERACQTSPESDARFKQLDTADHDSRYPVPSDDDRHREVSRLTDRSAELSKDPFDEWDADAELITMSGVSDASDAECDQVGLRYSHDGAEPTSSMSQSLDPVVGKFAALTRLEPGELAQVCPMCMEKLHVPSPYEDADGLRMDTCAVVRFPCSHCLHHNCAAFISRNQAIKSYFKCLTCDKIHGVLIGNQPEDGEMLIRLERTKKRLFSGSQSGGCLSGFPGTHTIVVEYRFPNGIQGPDHPRPGEPYYARDFPLTAYLPMTERGYEILCMLKIAFDRKLIFTVGTSDTDCDTHFLLWAGIEHKTSPSRDKPGNGFPDPGYFDKVTKELSKVGISPGDIPRDPDKALGIGFKC